MKQIWASDSKQFLIRKAGVKPAGDTSILGSDIQHTSQAADQHSSGYMGYS